MHKSQALDSSAFIPAMNMLPTKTGKQVWSLDATNQPSPSTLIRSNYANKTVFCVIESHAVGIAPDNQRLKRADSELLPLPSSRNRLDSAR